VRSALDPFRALLKRHDVRLAALALLVLVTFLPTLRFGLVYDDFDQLVQNPRITAWSYVPGYFTSHLWSQMANEAPHYYRPVFLLWFRLVDAVLGAPGSLWHLSSVLAHLGAVLCVFLLVRHVANDFTGALLAAAVFAIHPVNTEAVAWVSSSGDLLLTAFLVSSVYLYATRKGPISVASILLALLAMFVKEAGIVAPALIFVFEWTQSRIKNAAVNTAPYAIAALLYLALRTNALGSTVIVADPHMSFGAMLLTWPRILAFYLAHLVWPSHLSLCYNVPAEHAIWPLLLMIVVATAMAWLAYRTHSVFGTAWFVITLLPSLAIRYIDSHDYVHDRYLYLPSVGLAIIAAQCLRRVRFTPPRSCAAALLVVAMFIGTRLNLQIWRDNISLLTRAVQTDPTNAFMKSDLTKALLDAHRNAEAFPLAAQLIQEHPEMPDGYQNMAYYYHEVGNDDEARRYYAMYVAISQGRR
jgi:hypothetical protein